MSFAAQGLNFKGLMKVVGAIISLGILGSANLALAMPSELESTACASPESRRARFGGPSEFESSGAVWNAGDRRWDETYEQMYSQWIANEIGTDFLEKFKLTADCADLSAILRAVFARIHNLPVLFKGDGGASAIGHFTTEHAGLPTIADWSPENWQENLLKDRRFRAFLMTIPDRVNVRGIPQNTFPIEVYDPSNRERPSRYLRAGILHSRKNHVKIISGVDPNRWFAIRQLSATTPASVQRLTEYDAELDEQTEPGRGLAAYNWVVHCGSHGWQHVPDSMMPGHSQQQYTFVLPQKLREVGHHLGSHLETIARSPELKSPPANTASRELSALGGYLENRVSIVNRGAAATRALRSPSPELVTSLDDAFSTNSFDKGVVRRFEKIEALIQKFGKDMGLKPADLVRMTTSMPIQIGIDDLETTVYFFVKAMREKAITSDFRGSLEDRWGVAYLQALAEKLPKDLEHLSGKASQAERRKAWNERKLAEASEAGWVEWAASKIGISWVDPAVAEKRVNYAKWISFDQSELGKAVSESELPKAEWEALQKLRIRSSGSAELP